MSNQRNLKAPPPELLWLEAKQVLRGGKSTFFPDLTIQAAEAIRRAGLEKLYSVMCSRPIEACATCEHRTIECLTKEVDADAQVEST